MLLIGVGAGGFLTKSVVNIKVLRHAKRIFDTCRIS